MVEIEWERRLHQAGVGSGVAVGAGGLVVHERNTRLVGLDPADGSARWDVPAGRWPRAIVLAGERCLVLPQDTNRLMCVDLATGEDVWRVDLHSFTGHVVVGGDTVLVGGWRGYTPLRAVDLTTGRIRWESRRPVHTVRPAAVDGGFLIGEPGGSRVQVIDRQGGRRLAEWPLPHPLVDHDNRQAFTPVGDRFLVRCGEQAVVEIAPATGTVAELVVAAHPLRPVAPQHVGGLLWLPERGPGFTVADPHHDCPLWRIDVGQPLVGQVIAMAPSFVLAGSTGILFHVDTEGQVIARATVARRIHAVHPLGPAGVLAITKGTLLAAR